jgi:hypothetical protein
MNPPPHPTGESRRLGTRRQSNLVHTLTEQSLGDLTTLKNFVGERLISLITLNTDLRQWFSVKKGFS